MTTKQARFFSVGLGLVSLLIGLGMAQAPAKPGPEHQKLAYFAGKWTSEGDMKPSSLGPGGKFSSSSTCEWFDGDFALVCHSEGAMQSGSIKSLSILAWDAAAKTYTYFSTNSWGQGGFSRGTVMGDTWTWNNETTMNGKPVVVRFTMKQVSPDVATYKYEMGAPGEPLKVMMDGKQTRVTLASN